MKTYFLVFALVIGTAIPAFSQSSLDILDPVAWWSRVSVDPGKITQARMVIEPQGLFLKAELFLEFALKNPQFFGSNRWLETQFTFKLPADAVMVDSWLWVDDYISYGILQDKIVASNTYQSIVSWKADPSILFDHEDGNYELRIYPITSVLPRKVKLTFLLPITFDSQVAFAGLNFRNILPYLGSDTTKLRLDVVKDSIWGVPKLIESEANSFFLIQDSAYGHLYRKEIGNDLPYFVDLLAFSNPIQNGILNCVSPVGDNEGVFQTVVLPDEGSLDSTSRRVLILLDYDQENVHSITNTLELIETAAMAYLRDVDSFNLMYIAPQYRLKSGSSTWVSATDNHVNLQFFPGLPQNLDDRGDLEDLLEGAKAWLDAAGGSGEIVLFSPNDSYTRYYEASLFLGQVINSGILSYPMHIINYQTDGFRKDWQWTGSGYEFRPVIERNDYLFGQMAALSGGTYSFLGSEESSMYRILADPFLKAVGHLDVAELIAMPQSGFAHSTVSLDPVPWSNRGIRWVGKYFGSGPVSFDYFQLQGQHLSSTQYTSVVSDVDSLGKSATQMWAGQFLRQNASSMSPQQMVAFSVAEWVLSPHTAFLCLEDSVQRGIVGPDLTLTEVNEPKPVSTAYKIRLAPNPVQDRVKISVPATLADVEGATLDLYGITGSLVHSLDLSLFQPNGDEKTWTWESFPYSAGTYTLVLRSGQGVEILRFSRVE